MAERRGDTGSARKRPSRGDIRLDDGDEDVEDEEASLLAEVEVDDFETEVNPFAAPTPGNRRTRQHTARPADDTNPFQRR